MIKERRTLILAGAAAVLPVTFASAAPSPARSSATPLRPNSPDDQSAAIQREIDKAAETRSPVTLSPGTYLAHSLQLRTGVQLIGIKGASRLLLNGPGPLIGGKNCDHIGVSNLILDGLHRPLGSQGLLSIEASRHVVVEDCEMMNAAGTAVQLESVHGTVARCEISNAQQAGIFSRDADGLTITGNSLRDCKNNGILVWRSEPGEDGTIVVGNRITGIAAVAGGSGQNGNAINIYRADGVIVANNQIRSCAFSAVRGNRANSLQIIGNNCSDLGEVALYVELGSEGAIVANNVVTNASIGVSMTNFNEGGRLGVIQGNVLRNFQIPPAPGTDPDGGWGIGIHVEADVAVSGNVIEKAARFGISLGWGRYLRDANATGNVIRDSPIGIAISVSEGADMAMVKDNLVSGATAGAIVGFDKKRAVTGDLTRESTGRFSHLNIGGNVVRH